MLKVNKLVTFASHRYNKYKKINDRFKTMKTNSLISLCAELLITFLLFLNCSKGISIRKKRSIIATECTLPDANLGYCVPFDACPLLRYYDKTSADFLRVWGCGPKDEARENPRVCCNRRQIYYVVHNDSLPSDSAPSSECGKMTVAENSFPWTVKLLRRNNEGVVRFACTGALIHPRVVLTAAHCLVSPQLESFGPLIGIWARDYKRGGFQQFSISRSIPHPQYNISKIYKDHNDIGLIFLKSEITHLSRLCILQKLEEPLEYVFAGWNEHYDLESTNLKKIILVPFVWEQCYNKYKRINVTISVDQVCAGGEINKDTCSGDSGGPLMTYNRNDNVWSAAGIVSYGVTCGKRGWPAIYTYLPHYTEWIRKIISENLSDS